MLNCFFFTAKYFGFIDLFGYLWCDTCVFSEFFGGDRHTLIYLLLKKGLDVGECDWPPRCTESGNSSYQFLGALRWTWRLEWCSVEPHWFSTGKHSTPVKTGPTPIVSGADSRVPLFSVYTYTNSMTWKVQFLIFVLWSRPCCERHRRCVMLLIWRMSLDMSLLMRKTYLWYTP